MTQQSFDLIDPELRSAGRMVQLLLRPNKLGFRFLNWILRQAKGKDVDGLESQTVQIDRSAGTGQIRTRVFRPETAETDLPLVLFLHGGGYAMGTPEQDAYARMIKAWIETHPSIVVAPDYRLSLQEPYPAGLNDCYDALLWVKQNAAELGGRSDQIFVIGDSAGGGLTVAVCLMARDRGDVNIAFQMPLYPMLDDSQSNASAVNNNMPVWNSKTNKVGWALYLRDLVARGEDIPAYAAPARATDYTNLPPTATFVGALDPFLDETVAYVEKLKAAGIAVEFQIFDGCYHGFEQLVPEATISKEATGFMNGAYAYAVHNYFASQN